MSSFKPVAGEKRNLFKNFQLLAKHTLVTRHGDAWISIALFSLSLSCNYFHWFRWTPTIDHDATRLALHARDLLQENILPFYIYHQFGPHPLIVYVQALVFPAFGYNVASLNGLTIVGGALAAPATYWASRWTFDHLGAVFARRAGLIAALGLALSIFLALHSRLGIESALLPVTEMTAVGFLWRGLRRGNRVDFVLAGLLVGVSQYVYIVARFFPVALAMASAGALLANRRLLAHWRNLLLAAAAAAVVALPQWLMYLIYPYTLSARFIEADMTRGGRLVFELPNPAAAIASKLIAQLTAFSSPWYEDPLNGSSAILSPILVVGFAVGVAAVVIRQRRDGQLFALLMMALMLLPDLLTYRWGAHAAVDDTRIHSAIPFVFVVAGLGSAAIWTWLEGRPRFPPRTGYLFLALILIFDLFRLWDFARQAHLDYRAGASREGLFAEFITDNLDRPILVPSRLYAESKLAFLLIEQFPHRKGGMEDSLRQGERVTVILQDPHWSADKGLPEEWVLLKDGTVFFLPRMPGSIEPLHGRETTILTPNGLKLAKALDARWLGGTPAYMPLEALSFANHLELVGFRSNEFEPGSNLDVTLFWRPAQKIRRDVELVVELHGRAQDVTVASRRVWPLNGVYRVRAWRPGQTIPLNYSFALRPDLLPDRYQLKVGLIDLLSRQRVPLLSGGQEAIVKTFHLQKESRAPQIPADINFANFLKLEGYTLAPTGEDLKILFFWRALKSPDSDYTLFVHLVNSDDQIVAQLDAEPYFGKYPTSLWLSNRLYVIERTIPSISAGDYQLFVGWYTHEEGGWRRLSTVARKGTPATDHLLLDTITLP